MDRHLGARSELIACEWLLSQGYEVFRNVSATGPIDVVAIKGSEVLLLDVKSSGSALSAEQRALGVKALRVNRLTGACTIHSPTKQFRGYAYGRKHRTTKIGVFDALAPIKPTF